MKKLLPFLFLLFAALAPRVYAQGPGSGLAVNQVGLPVPFPTVVEYFFDGNNLVQYICTAQQIQSPTSVQFADTSLTSIVVATNVATVTTAAAHNLYVGARVKTTGSATTALNNTYTVATVPSSTTYTFTTSGVGDATYTTGLVVTTSNPLLNASVWAIQIFTNSGPSNAVADSHFAIPTVGLNQSSQTPQHLACSNRAQY